MSLTEDEKQKLYGLQKKLTMILKTSTNSGQRKRISKELDTVNSIIQDVEKGREVDAGKLRLFSSKKTGMSSEAPPDKKHGFADLIEIVNISGRSKDSEMNEIYSYVAFFEKNLMEVIEIGFKLDYDINKAREDFIVHYNKLQRDIEEYKHDVDTFDSIINHDKTVLYQRRLREQKNTIFMKLGEVFKELRKILLTIKNSPETLLINKNDTFNHRAAAFDNSIYEEKHYIEILGICLDFIDEFKHVLRSPNFR